MAQTHTVEYRSKGIGLFGWLFLIFLVLKLNPGSHLDTPIEDTIWRNLKPAGDAKLVEES